MLIFHCISYLFLNYFRSLFGWSARTGEFLFSRRYCHAGEISAVDVTGQIIVTGSRDKSLGVWALQDNCVNPFLVKQVTLRKHQLYSLQWLG